MRDRVSKRAGRARRLILLGAVVGGAGALLGACLAAASHVARRMVMRSRQAPTPITVLAVERTTEGDVVRLSAGEDSDLPGARYSLLFDQDSASPGHARLGGLIRKSAQDVISGEAWVERELLGVDRGNLSAGSRGRITGWWYSAVTALDSAAEEIQFPVDGGNAAAWIVPARNAGDAASRWAIHVHGRGARPEETLRGVRVAAESGRTSLVITYRGDEEAPASAHDRYGFGAAEWRDVAAAMKEAERRGARSVTLFGWSMGATACLLAAERVTKARVTARIDGLVLDSPALDWRQLIVHHTALAGAPRVLGRVASWLLESGWVRSGNPGGIPLRTLTPQHFASQLRVPTLVHCSPHDTFVPEGPARELAALRPDLVTLHRSPRGEHVRIWNVEPERWDEITRAFLDRI